jgi:hypothetical protein
MTLAPPADSFRVTRPIFNQDTDTRGFVGYDSVANEVFVVFRGSEDVVNWVTDLEMTQVEYSKCPNCFVHQGFLNAELSVIDEVRREAERLLLLHPTADLIVTGHSLGAALATLCAVDLKLAGMAPILINFGSPRVVNHQGSEFISQLLVGKYRVTHLNDVIVHTPLEALGFEHITGEWYDNGTTVRPCQSTAPEDKNCAAQWDWSTLSFTQHLVYLNTTVVCPALPSVRPHHPTHGTE